MEKNRRKTAVITGATSGLGLECATQLARRGWRVILPCRDAQRGQLARAHLATAATGTAAEVTTLDVANLESVRAFIRAMHDSGPIDALICNAGIQETGAVSLTSEGFETTFATNHLGHFLLARGLLGELSSHGCVVFVSSNTHDPTKHTGMPAPAIDDVDDLAHGRAFQDQAVSVAARRRYTTSKLCNVLCAYELDRRLRAVTAPAPSSLRVYAFDPGLMPGTGLARGYGAAARFGWKYVLPVLTLVVPNTNSVCLSGSRLARIADEDAAPASGTYITRGRVAPSSKLSYDDELAKRLWESSARLCGLPADLMSEETRR